MLCFGSLSGTRRQLIDVADGHAFPSGILFLVGTDCLRTPAFQAISVMHLHIVRAFLARDIAECGAGGQCGSGQESQKRFHSSHSLKLRHRESLQRSRPGLGRLGISTSTEILQWGQCSASRLARPTLTQKPTRPIDLPQLGQGISNRLQNAATRTTPMRIANTIRIARIRGAYPAAMPMARRKATASMAYRSLRRTRYWRIVIHFEFSGILRNL